MEMYGPTMQCNVKTFDDITCSKCPPLAITQFSLNHHRSFASSMTINQTLPQLINISHRMLTDPLLQHCQDSAINRTAVGYVKKPQVWCYDEVGRLATKQLDSCAHTLSWHAVLFKLKLVLCFRLYNKYEIRLRWEIYCGICLPKLSK